MAAVSGSDFKPVGCLNWYAIRPTDLGQKNRKISGDKKGNAAQMLEAGIEAAGHAGLVAGFANSNAGDVSGNVSNGVPDGVHDEARMKGRTSSSTITRPTPIRFMWRMSI